MRNAINGGPIFSRVGPSPPERSEERRKNGARTGLVLSPHYLTRLAELVPVTLPQYSRVKSVARLLISVHLLVAGKQRVEDSAPFSLLCVCVCVCVPHLICKISCLALYIYVKTMSSFLACQNNYLMSPLTVTWRHLKFF